MESLFLIISRYDIRLFVRLRISSEYEKLKSLLISPKSNSIDEEERM